MSFPADYGKCPKCKSKETKILEETFLLTKFRCLKCKTEWWCFNY